MRALLARLCCASAWLAALLLLPIAAHAETSLRYATARQAGIASVYSYGRITALAGGRYALRCVTVTPVGVWRDGQRLL